MQSCALTRLAGPRRSTSLQTRRQGRLGAVGGEAGPTRTGGQCALGGAKPEVLSIGGRQISCPPLFEQWKGGEDEGEEDREDLVCGPRGCVPVDVLVADESGAFGWMDRFHALALHHKKVFGSKCCYCGDDAGNDSAPCSFQGCSCTWAVAEAVWIQGMDTDGAKRYFQEAVDAEPENAELQAAFAIFCWLGLEDVIRARQHYDLASRLDPANLNIAASRAYFEMMAARGGAAA